MFYSTLKLKTEIILFQHRTPTLGLLVEAE